MVLWLSTFAVLADRAALWHDFVELNNYYVPQPISLDISSLYSEFAPPTAAATAMATAEIRDASTHIVTKAAGPLASPVPTAAAQLPVHLNYIARRNVFKDTKTIYTLLAVSSALGAVEW
jgi:hypothetical protein